MKVSLYHFCALYVSYRKSDHRSYLIQFFSFVLFFLSSEWKLPTITHFSWIVSRYWKAKMLSHHKWTHHPDLSFFTFLFFFFLEAWKDYPEANPQDLWAVERASVHSRLISSEYPHKLNQTVNFDPACNQNTDQSFPSGPAKPCLRVGAFLNSRSCRHWNVQLQCHSIDYL